MELRHLRCFIAVAEELHFTRAAERLHIEQSPLSRTIRQLEDDLGVRLLDRNSHTTQLTSLGRVFLNEARHILAAVDRARSAIGAATKGQCGALRIALSDCIFKPRLGPILARCRSETPQIEVRLSEVPLDNQLNGLRDNFYDAGFAMAMANGEDLTALPAWSEPLVVAMPSRHPLRIYKQVPLDKVLCHPLVLCDPIGCEGFSWQMRKVLHSTCHEPKIAERVATHDLMMALVAAGYGLGVTTQTQLTMCRYPEILARPLAGQPQRLATYLLYRAAVPSDMLATFIEKVTTTD